MNRYFESFKETAILFGWEGMVSVQIVKEEEEEDKYLSEDTVVILCIDGFHELSIKG